MTVLSYHNDQAVKDYHVAQARRHYELDILRSGTYGNLEKRDDHEVFVACSIGCMAHDIDPDSEDKHKTVADHAGWPLWLAYLSESMFEGLPADLRAKFHVDLREAIPIGKDLEPVQWKLAVARHERQLEALKYNKEDYAVKCYQALHLVINYCKAKVEGTATEDQRKEAEKAADSAADSAESARLADLARSAYWSASWSAESASWSAVWSSAELALSANSAESHWLWERDTLLKLLIEA